jgi:GNAT superfamily N-acetyltransferase
MIAIRPFTADDVEFGFLLKEQAGWNQTRGDWRRFLRLQGDGCFVAEWEGRPAGTVVVCVFGPVAWIAMMLVETSLRGRGLGRALMERALAFADEQQAESVRLDATPLGQPLYEKLGFTADYALTRYGGAPLLRDESVAELPIVTVEEIAALDRRVTGTDRRRLLEALWDEQPGRGVIRNGAALGYCAARPGSKAVHIGPCIADASAGPQLLNDAFRRYAGQPVFLDIPDAHRPANLAAATAGLSPQRQLLRMTRGPRLEEQLESLWASSGPEKG